MHAEFKKVMLMKRFRITSCIFVVTLLVAACMYALNISLEPPLRPHSHLLLIGSGSEENWQRTVEGARAAAKELNIALDVELPTSNDANWQNALVRETKLSAYDGIVISPIDPDSQMELLNDLAGRTKLVTIDRDSEESKRLCHIAYSQASEGRLAARLVAERLSRPGKVALLISTVSDDPRDTKTNQRLAGFKEMWGPSGPNEALPCPIIQVATDSENSGPRRQDLCTILTDPELAYIVALDSKAAAAALDALAGQSETQHLPIIAFDPSEAIFDAIDDGRVCSAIFDDPYQVGYTAIQRLDAYRSADKDSLPVPGYGSHYLTSEVVQKANLADVRQRTGRLPSIASGSLARNFRITQSSKEPASNGPL